MRGKSPYRSVKDYSTTEELRKALMSMSGGGGAFAEQPHQQEQQPEASSSTSGGGGGGSSISTRLVVAHVRSGHDRAAIDAGRAGAADHAAFVFDTGRGKGRVLRPVNGHTGSPLQCTHCHRIAHRFGPAMVGEQSRCGFLARNFPGRSVLFTYVIDCYGRMVRALGLPIVTNRPHHIFHFFVYQGWTAHCARYQARPSLCEPLPRDGASLRSLLRCKFFLPVARVDRK
jgi:hypothetical protein